MSVLGGVDEDGIGEGDVLCSELVVRSVREGLAVAGSHRKHKEADHCSAWKTCQIRVAAIKGSTG